MLAPILTTPPNTTPVTLTEAKAHLRVDSSDEDLLIQSLIEAATAHFDGYAGILGRCLIEQVWTVKYSDWPASNYLRLPFPDVSAVTVKYFDVSNVEQTLSSGDVAILHDERGSLVRFADDYDYPAVYDGRDDGVQVAVTAGYGDDGADVPAAIRAAILLMVGHLYQNREAVASGVTMQLPLGVQALIAPYRRVGL
jgi:uncharacterized phiE125 gp8 family phage protein